jgi:hypothetical protein
MSHSLQDGAKQAFQKPHLVVHPASGGNFTLS